MEIRAHYVLIGAVVMITMAAALLYILWQGRTQQEYDEYDIIFTERVSGLLVGAQVRFNGIQKGEVESLKIDPDDPSVVIARVRVDRDTPVKTDTEAELEPVGFTGINIIQLVGGGIDSELLKNASQERVPIIRAKQSGFNQLFEGSGDLIDQARKILSDKNIEGVSGIIANVETLTGAFADNEDDLVAILNNVDQLTADLASMTAKLDAAATSLQSLLESDAAETFEDVESLIEESNALVEELRGIASENRTSLRVFADQGLGQVAPALAEARRLMRTLDYMLREIDRDPQAYFLGEQAPEYGGEGE